MNLHGNCITLYMLFARKISSKIKEYFLDIPVTAIIGARQVGKSTLAKKLLKVYKEVIYLDLETKIDKQLLEEPAEFFQRNKSKIICIDEVQLLPEIFSEIRSFVDNNEGAKFLILGSSSPELLRQSAETLAGRIFYYELSTFLWQEVSEKINLETYWVRGGFPRSVLARSEQLAFLWLENYIKTFLERDLRMFGLNILPQIIRRLWIMLAHINGQTLNYSQLANSMGISQPTIKHYVSILHHTFMLRILPPYFINIKKRLVKSPKVYIRDTGILHTLLNISSFDQLYAHPTYGSSWEVVVIENIISKYDSWEYFYYRTSNGAEIDLILTKGKRIIAIEIKSSTLPKVSKGFWTALKDIKPTEAYVIAPVKIVFPLKNDVLVYPLKEFLEKE